MRSLSFSNPNTTCLSARRHTHSCVQIRKHAIQSKHCLPHATLKRCSSFLGRSSLHPRVLGSLPLASSSASVSEGDDQSNTQNSKNISEEQQENTHSPDSLHSTTALLSSTLTTAIETALSKAPVPVQTFIKAAYDIFRLAFLFPFRYAVIAPLTWLLARVRASVSPKEDILAQLETANKESRVEADEVADALRMVNVDHPEKVIEFVEKKCLLRIQSANKQDEEQQEEEAPFHANVNVMREYLIALVKTKQIDKYTSENNITFAGTNSSNGEDSEEDPGTTTTTSLPPMNHRSFQRLLDEIKAAAGGSPLSAAPGTTAVVPLHVIVHNKGFFPYSSSSASSPSRSTSSLWILFNRSVLLLTMGIILGTLWAIGEVFIRRHNALNAINNNANPSSSSSSAATGGLSSFGGSNFKGPGQQPGIGFGMSGGPGIQDQKNPGMNSMFAPKEYSKENIPEKSIKSFKDVKGCDEAVEELQEIVDYLKSPDKFTRLGGKLPKGVLLTGPPGTGKTLLARAVAGEAGVPFFYKAGSEFDEMFVGVGSRRVRSLFAAAKKKAPCIVFIDEIDAVGGKRTNWEASGGSRKTLNQLLTEMDGFEENSGIVVMAATNLPELLDTALTRPGRFDRHVAVSLPDVRGRTEILKLYVDGKPLSSDVSVETLARRTPGFSGAELSNLVNEAALLAARHDADHITADTLDEARDKILMGSPRSLIQTDEARRLTAYHEGGHALVALYTPSAKPIHKATIVPRGHALGMVSQLPDKDEFSTTKQQMIAHMDVCMGGKAAEELIFGAHAVTSGATSDLKSATRLARHMVEDCGMSERIGPVAILDDSSTVSSETRKVVDEEVQWLLKDAYTRVAALLKERERELHSLAAALLERETLTQRDIKELLWGEEAVVKEEREREAAEALLSSSNGGSGKAVPVSSSIRASAPSSSSGMK